MRMSRLFFQTLRDAPADARRPGYQYLLRGGFILPQDGVAGAQRSFAFLPLGVRLRERIEAEVRRTLTACGGQSISSPSVRLLEHSAPPVATGPRPLRFRDRAMREMISDVSHEASVLRTASAVVRSYRQLPALLFEGWQLYRDEERAADGLFGATEGRVVDAFGLHADEAALAEGYSEVREALAKLLGDWRLEAIKVIRLEDAAGRPVDEAMVAPSAEAELTFARCSGCGYAAEAGVARVPRSAAETEAPLPPMDVETPNCKTIAELGAYLGVPTSRTAKALFLSTYSPEHGERFTLAVVRGDTALHEDKLRAALNVDTIGAATEAEIRAAGAEPGYGSPLGLTNVTIVVDELVAQSANLVAGANRTGYHTINVNCGRDYQPSLIADIAGVQEGSPCAQCGSPLLLEQGVVLTELRQSGTEPGRNAGALYLNEVGQSRPLALGSYRIHIDRLLAALAERHHDKSGLTWPSAVAPFDVHLVTLGKASEAVQAAAARLYAELGAAGLAVLFDDRDERAGVKFNDADLIGVPLRVVVGERGLQNGSIEVKHRDQVETQQLKLDELVGYACEVRGAHS